MNGVISPGQAEVTNQMPPHADAPRAPRQKWASYFERRYATPRAPRPRNHYGVRYNLEDDPRCNSSHIPQFPRSYALEYDE
jgi:hypothetical protein